MKYAAAAAIAGASLASAGQLVWPSKWDELEDFYTMHSGYYRRGFSDSVNPCSFGSNVKGRQNAAEWIRTGFHDMATHDAKAGTGGLDGSIWWELDRAENIGSAFNNTFGFFSGFFSERVSASDLIALGVITATGACNGPKIPLRGGRIDANQAGPAGVPEPQTDLDTTLKTFETAGFNKEDMIAMVACGHSLGGVHSEDFPDLTELPALPDQSVTFQNDSSRFTNGVVTEFLSNSTRNPLVVASNDTLNSDKRIFESDGRVTMNKMADNATFKAMCADIFTRMIDTVPSNVNLSDVIDPYDVRPYVQELSMKNGTIYFQGRVRMRITNGSGRSADDTTVQIQYADNSGQGRTVVNATRATYKLGITSGLLGEGFVFFEFEANIKADTGISKFWIVETTKSTGATKTHDNQGTGGYPLDDTILYQQDDSCWGTDLLANGQIPIKVKAMVREDRASAPLSLRVIRKTARSGVIVPIIGSESVAFNATGNKQGGYVEYSAESWSARMTTVDILLGGSNPASVEFQSTGTMKQTCGAA